MWKWVTEHSRWKEGLGWGHKGERAWCLLVNGSRSACVVQVDEAGTTGCGCQVTEEQEATVQWQVWAWLQVSLEAVKWLWTKGKPDLVSSWGFMLGAEQRTCCGEAQGLMSRPHRKLLGWPGQAMTAWGLHLSGGYAAKPTSHGFQ